MRKLTLILLWASTPLTAQQVVTEHEGVRLNWSQLRLAFHGTAHGTTWVKLEKLAWWQGFRHLQRVMPHLYAQHHPTATGIVPQQVTNLVFRNLQLQETFFFSDRRVRLTFNSSLANVFAVAVRGAAKVQLPQARHSGLILRAVHYFPPRAVYEIRGKSGRRYFDASMVQEEYFRRGLMGRYFRHMSAPQLSRYVGQRTQELTVREISPAVLEVDDRAWREFARDNSALLAKARIAVIFPASQHN